MPEHLFYRWNVGYEITDRSRDNKRGGKRENKSPLLLTTKCVFNTICNSFSALSNHLCICLTKNKYCAVKISTIKSTPCRFQITNPTQIMGNLLKYPWYGYANMSRVTRHGQISINQLIQSSLEILLMPHSHYILEVMKRTLSCIRKQAHFFPCHTHVEHVPLP